MSEFSREEIEEIKQSYLEGHNYTVKQMIDELSKLNPDALLKISIVSNTYFVNQEINGEKKRIIQCGTPSYGKIEAVSIVKNYPECVQEEMKDKIASIYVFANESDHFSVVSTESLKGLNVLYEPEGI